MKFFQKLFPPSFCPFLGVYKPIFKYQLVSTLNTISHCRRMRSSLATRPPPLLTSKYDIALQTNEFITSDEPVLCWRRTLLALETISYFWRWRRTLVALETNSFRAGDELVSRWIQRKRAFELQPHTQLATSNFQTKVMSRWSLLSHSYLPPKTGAIALRRSVALSRCGDSVALNWSSKIK